MLPGGGAVNPVNDARYYEINPTYTTWAIANGRNSALSRWLFDSFVLRVPGGGAKVGELIPTLLWYAPSDPAFDPSQQLPLAEDFADRGLVHVRSGWGADDLMASFEARQTDWGEAVHLNQDVGQFTLYSDGAKLVVDSRYANWLSKMAARDPEAARSSESEAHNVVVPDGRSQAFHGKGDLVAFATTASVGHAGSVDVALADARLAWLVNQPTRADRVFLHVRATPGTPDYIVVADRFAAAGGGAHSYTSYLHTDWRNAVTVAADDPGSVQVASGELDGVTLAIDVNASLPIVTNVGSFTPDDAEDWARIGLPGRKAQPRIEVSATGAEYDAITVLVPAGPGEAAPAFHRIAASGGIATVVDAGAGVTDTLLLATGAASTVEAAGVRTDALFASVRRGPDGVAHVTMVQGTYVDVDGVRVMASPSGPTTRAAEV